MLEVTPNIQIADAELIFSFARSGGPGGQNVNKVNSKAILHWPVEASAALPDDVKARFLARYGNRLTKEGVLVLHSQRCRDQAGNVEDCRQRLRKMVLDVVTPPTKRRPTRPSKGAKLRRLQGKKENAQKKEQRRPPRFNE